MNALPRKAIIIGIQIILVSSFTRLFSQTDSVKTIYRQELADSSDYNYHRKYQYLDINLKDETSIFKIAIPTFSLAHNNDPLASTPTSENFNFYFEFEQKINPSLSLIIRNANILDLSATTSVNTSLNFGIRYYVNMADQIKQGVKGNNCNGIYIDFFLLSLNQFQYTQNYVKENAVTYNFYPLYDYSKLLEAPTMDLNLGFQKRLNNFSFINTMLYMEFTPQRSQKSQNLQFNSIKGYDEYINVTNTVKSHFNFGLSFSIGLGWGLK